MTKKSIVFLGLIFASFTAISQTIVTKDANGNYVTLKQPKKASSDKKTGDKFVLSSGESLDIYESKNGKLYVIRVSKGSGNEYKQYLKTKSDSRELVNF